MSPNEHKDYHEEKERLDYTIGFIEATINATDDNRNRLKADIKEAYGDIDSSSSYVRIISDTQFLDRMERNFDKLVKLRKKPYFCRIDFQHQGKNSVDKLYIGKMSLTTTEEDTPLVIDWRAPIASVYYDGRLGHVTYETPVGISDGELHLKRQYTINDGKLEQILDVDITASDTFLQAALGENKDNRLKDIVSTIQSEQNDIIRANIGKPLIVQGAAGSGKTTIALHRIAYLIYTYEKTFDPDNFLIIAPNRLFLNYISDVLPELGVEQVRQTTFVDLVYELCGIPFKLKSPDEKLKLFISHHNGGSSADELTMLRRISQFKGSLEFCNIVDRYFSKLEQSFMPSQDFTLGKHTILTVTEIKNLYHSQLSNLPLYKRLAELKKSVSGQVKKFEVSMLKRIEDYYEKQMNHIRYTMEPSDDKQKKLVELMDLRDEKMERLKNACKSAVENYFSQIPKLKIMDHYRELTTDLELYNHVMDHEFIECFSKHNDNLFNNKKIELEDLTTLLYLKHKIYGIDKKIIIKYIVIDEAQDFSLFQFYALKKVFNTEMFTILGDLAQGIHSYRGIRDWGDVLARVFDEDKSIYLTLEQSYRTTIEIMDVANEMIKLSTIPGLALAKPVIRHGDKPCIYRFSCKDKLIDVAQNRLLELSKNYSTVAVICKTDEECNRVKKLLDKRGIITTAQLNSDDINYQGGTVIVPSYMAKGLEFDAVVLVSIDETYLVEELDIKLLYVAMTRALHSMDVMYLDNTMNLLEKINDDLVHYIR